MVGSIGADKRPVIQLLADEFDADRISATPDHLTVSPRPRVRRKRQPQRAGQRACVVGCDFSARARDVLHHAGAHREAAVKRDPAGPAQRFARFTLLGRGHCIYSSRSSPHLLPRALEIVARYMESQGYFTPRKHADKPRKAGFRRLARPHKGHYTFARPRDAAPVCSLRLSVRTPPFHGGESGSIPLGSASTALVTLISFLFFRFPQNSQPRFGEFCSLYGRLAFQRRAARP